MIISHRYLSDLGEPCAGSSANTGACFASNSGIRGGALNIFLPEDFEASAAAFVGNNAATGGGVWLRTDNDNFEYSSFDSCAFVGNGAGDGGALFQDSQQHGFSVTSSVFRENFAGEKVP